MKMIRTVFRLAAVLLPMLFQLQAFASASVPSEAFSRKPDKEPDTLKSVMSRFGEVAYYIQNSYLEKLDLHRLTDRAIEGMVRELDPHSVYVPAAEVRAMNEPLKGEFSGIGIEFAVISDTLTVQSVLSGGPAEKVGMAAGDKIVMCNGKNIVSDTLGIREVHSYLRGPEKSVVELGVVRRGVKDPIVFKVRREKIPLHSVEASYEIAPDVCYIRLSRFAASSYDEFMRALRGMGRLPSALLLDLRGNSGGYLHIALRIVNQFLDRGDLMLYTEGAAEDRRNHYADGTGVCRKMRLAVLVDENSASASEIVAGAVQDWDRGIIVGRRTFGKGLVQKAIQLSDGSELRLTAARYHTPSGRVIQAPYEKGQQEEYFRRHYRRYENDEFYGAQAQDSVPDGTPEFRTLRRKRPVYGGGGIAPDVPVPIDTSFVTPFYLEVLRGNCAPEYVNSFFDGRKPHFLTRYPDFFTFRHEFDEADFLDGFLVYLEKKGVVPTDEELRISSRKISMQLKALAASNLFGPEYYFRIANLSDPAVSAALSALVR